MIQTALLDSLHQPIISSAVIDSAAVDTSHHMAATAAHGGEGNLFAQLLEHNYDSHELEFQLLGQFQLPHFPPIHVLGMTIDLSITKHVFYLWIAALILIAVAVTAARKNKNQRVPRGIGNFIEIIIVFIRDEIVLPNMGSAGMKYIAYLLTTFFFILVMNLLGLVPYGATPTANIAVTAGLAIIAFIMIQLSAIREQGLKKYLAHLTGGVHWSLWLIMVPIEIIGLFTKPFALCIRLFANMTGGHIVLLSLIGLIFLFKSFAVAPLPVLFILGINLLELFVAVLQAYIFTMLTALFMGIGIQGGHEEEHSH